jgi:hypothetical protein
MTRCDEFGRFGQHVGAKSRMVAFFYDAHPTSWLGNNCVKQLFGNRMRFFTESIHS